jgi:hypothetical protein
MILPTFLIIGIADEITSLSSEKENSVLFISLYAPILKFDRFVDPSASSRYPNFNSIRFFEIKGTILWYVST